MKNIDSLPILDCQIATQLIGNDKQISHDILSLLVKELPHDLIAINELFSQKKYAQLYQRLHRLHGALCYCGTPRLKAIVSQIELKLKNKAIEDLTLLLDKFRHEVNLLLEHHQNHTC